MWVLVGFYAWANGRHRATRDHVERVERTQADQRRELDVLQERIRHVPTAAEVAQVSAEVRVLAAKLDGLGSGIETINVRLHRIEDYMSGTT